MPDDVNSGYIEPGPGECACYLPTKPPEGMSIEWWRPDLDDDPGPRVKAVVRYGENPLERRAVRRSDGTGWDEVGSTVDYYTDITPPMPWDRTGLCWADTHHPVVACEPWPL